MSKGLAEEYDVGRVCLFERKSKWCKFHERKGNGVNPIPARD